MPAPSPIPLTPDLLWALPRVGAPEPAPDGSWAVVPVTTIRPDAAEGSTRLWRVAEGEEPRPLTAEGVSASGAAVDPTGRRYRGRWRKS